jgi:hypothetical protein
VKMAVARPAAPPPTTAASNKAGRRRYEATRSDAAPRRFALELSGVMRVLWAPHVLQRTISVRPSSRRPTTSVLRLPQREHAGLEASDRSKP